MGQSNENMDDFFGKSLDTKVQFTTNNLPVGNHKVKYVERKYIPSTQGGMDRIELYVEIIETDNADVVVGNKYSIPHFKDKHGFGVKDLARFICQTTDSEDLLTGKEIISTLDELVGNVCDVKAYVKKGKDGNPIVTQKGHVINGYDYGVFEALQGV